MKLLKSWMIGNDNNIERRNMIWNIIGSFVYAFASMFLSMVVMAVSGEELGGIFAFAFGTFGQQMFIVAYFGMRPFQVTDVTGKYSFGDYLTLRMMTCIAAVAIALGFVAVTGYSSEKIIIIILMVLYKTADGFADVYESEFQRSGKLYLTGKSNTFRTILSVACFIGVLCTSRNLIYAGIAAVSGQAAGIWLLDISIIRELKSVSWSVNKNHIKQLLLLCTPLFFSAFLDMYIMSAAKYSVNARLGDSLTGYFNMIFMPANIVNLAANFIIRPMLTKLSYLWSERKTDAFIKQIRNVSLLITLLGCIAAAGTLLLGKPVLIVFEWLLGSGYTDKLVQYKSSLVLVMAGGGFYALQNLAYYVLVIFGRQRSILAVYCIASAAAVILCNPMVELGGIFGAAAAYVMLMLILTVCFGVTAAVVYRGEKDNV